MLARIHEAAIVDATFVAQQASRANRQGCGPRLLPGHPFRYVVSQHRVPAAAAFSFRSLFLCRDGPAPTARKNAFRPKNSVLNLGESARLRHKGRGPQHRRFALLAQRAADLNGHQCFPGLQRTPRGQPLPLAHRWWQPPTQCERPRWHSRGRRRCACRAFSETEVREGTSEFVR